MNEKVLGKILLIIGVIISILPIISIIYLQPKLNEIERTLGITIFSEIGGPPLDVYLQLIFIFGLPLIIGIGFIIIGIYFYKK